jgi:predicted metal-dependent hydrolase
MFKYKVIKSNRKTLSIIIERDKSVVVRAPQTLSDDRIKDEVNKRKVLIKSKIDSEQKAGKRNEKEFVDGEQFLYMGKYYSLHINITETQTIEFNEAFIVNAKNIEIAKKLVFNWYQQQAKEILVPRIKYFAEHLGVKRKRININSAKYTWGSCTPAGTLNFNWRIIKAPSDVMDYIVVHELAHLREHNHSRDFWNIVAVQIPQFEDAKLWLKYNGHELDEDF